METSKESAGLDKQGLYGWWHNSVKWQDKLHRKTAHKALDIPEDDPVINANKYGMGWKELAAIGLLMAGGMGGTAYVMSQQQQQAAPPPVPQQASPADAGYEVVFYDAGGNQIQLDRWPGETK